MLKHERLLRHARIVQQYLDGAALPDIGVPVPTIYWVLRLYDVPRRARPDPTPDRTADMERRYRVGETLEKIGQAHGVTRERVRQILLKHRGMTAADGGITLSALKRTHDIRAKREGRSRRLFERWGLTLDEYLAHVAEYGNTAVKGSPLERFKNQKNSARFRGIAWGITFKDWWRLWQESGHWADRGQGRYCMARIGDSGPYAVGNVEIITQSQNSRDSFLIHPAAARAAKARANRLAKAQQPEQLAA